MDYKGKWTLVTGAGKPGKIGPAVAEYLGAKGSNIYLHYRSDPEAAEKISERVRLAGKEYRIGVELVQGDLANREDVERIFRTISPDILINNAADFRHSGATFEMDLKEYLEKSEEALSRNLDSNLKSAILVTDAFVYRMVKERKKGVVVFVGDAFIERGGAYPSGLEAYTASKSFVRYVVRNYASSYGKSGIRFLGILNGPIVPPRDIPEETFRHMREEINMPESTLDPWIGGKAVAEAIDNLIGTQYANGTCIELDGGRVWTTKREH